MSDHARRDGETATAERRAIDAATLSWTGGSVELPLVPGVEGDTGLDIGKLRADSGFITFDPGYGNIRPSG